MIDMKKIKLKWHGEVPQDKNLDELELTIMKDIEKVFSKMSDPRPSKLITHTVFIGETMYDECVSVWGVENDDHNFHCEYIIKPEWVSLNQLKLEDGE